MSTETSELFKAHKDHLKNKRADNLKSWDRKGWDIHSEYHWSQVVNGERLDFWPSRNKFRYRGKTMCGDVLGFIKNQKENK